MRQEYLNMKNNASLPITVDEWQKHMDQLTKSESNHLPFVWMRVILLDKLQKESFADRLEDGTFGIAIADTGQNHLPCTQNAITTNDEASDNPRSVPYVSAGAAGQDRHRGVFIKGKCAVIASGKKGPVPPDPKPYPVSGSEVARRREPAFTQGCPDFQKEFALYSKGKLPLNFLYLFWGKNLGTFFNQTLFDILRYYRAFGAKTFKRAIRAMVASLNPPANSLPDDLINRDMDALAGMSCQL